MSGRDRPDTDGGAPWAEALGAVVLCGGASRRMGAPKAWLDFGGEPLLCRVVRRIAPACAPIVVVAAPEQPLPALPPEIDVARDPIAGRGPLQGLAVGLGALAARVSHAFVCATDAPFVSAALVRRLRALGSESRTVEASTTTEPPSPPAAFEVVVPVCEDRDQLLCALYATALGARAEARLARAELRLGGLLEQARVRRVTSAELLADAELARVDPGLRCLLGINTDADYRAALAMLDSHPQSGCAPR